MKYIPKSTEELRKLVRDESINLGDIDTSEITDMSYLFVDRDSDKYCERKDFSGINTWDTSNVECTEGMFYNCIYFNEEVNFGNSFIFEANSMFENCISFDKDIVFGAVPTCTRNMFKNCKVFNSKIIFNGNGEIEDAESMFEDCVNFNQPIQFDKVSSIDNACYMFINCKSFNQNMDFPNLCISDVSGMFEGCESFNSKVRFDTEYCSSFYSMFKDCISFNQDVYFNTNMAESFRSMFENCKNLNSEIILDNTESCEDFSNMFKNCISFNQKIGFKSFSATSFESMFENCINLNQKIYLIGSECRCTEKMFYGCHKLKSDVILDGISYVDSLGAYENFGHCIFDKLPYEIEYEPCEIHENQIYLDFEMTLKEYLYSYYHYYLYFDDVSKAEFIKKYTKDNFQYRYIDSYFSFEKILNHMLDEQFYVFGTSSYLENEKKEILKITTDLLDSGLLPNTDFDGRYLTLYQIARIFYSFYKHKAINIDPFEIGLDDREFSNLFFELLRDEKSVRIIYKNYNAKLTFIEACINLDKAFLEFLFSAEIYNIRSV